MPTVIKPQPEKVGRSWDRLFESSNQILTLISYSDSYLPVLHTSFGDLDSSSADPDTPATFAIAASENGFVHTVLNAFQQDQHLELRPDDVWLSILSQLGFFINGRADALRQFFVRHQGQMAVEVDMRPYELHNVNVDIFVERMTALVKSQMTDPAVAEWILPQFSTTTQTDRTVASMMFMGAMQQYFKYRMRIGCGFPSVTLHGTKEDWELIRRCVSRFGDLGEFDGLAEWIACLDRVLQGVIAGFDRPDADEVRDFWMRAAHAGGARASGGVVTLSGWLTTFCFWQADGSRTRSFTDEELGANTMLGKHPEEWARLELAGVGFPVIERDRIPAARVHVPVRVSDGFSVVDTLIIAGMIGTELDAATLSTAKPRPGWWLLHKK